MRAGFIGRKVLTLRVPALHFSSSSFASSPCNTFVKRLRQPKATANPLTSSLSLHSLSGSRRLKKTPQNILSSFFFPPPPSFFPQEPNKSLACSCFLYKSRDELELIKAKLRGHMEVLGSVKMLWLLLWQQQGRGIQSYTHTLALFNPCEHCSAQGGNTL